jgi:small subunit ribosomal protein S13
MAKAKKGNKANTKGGSKNKSQNRKKSNPIVKVIKKERVFKKVSRPIPSHINLSNESDDFKQVIRISGVDVPGYLSVANGIAGIYGVGHRVSKIVESVFEKNINKSIKRVGYLLDSEVEILDEIILNLDKYVPEWVLNRSKNMDGKKVHIVMADLRLAQRKEIQMLGKIKSYRGLRLQWGLPVRGQKTKSTFRKGGAIGVNKKK